MVWQPGESGNPEGGPKLLHLEGRRFHRWTVLKRGEGRSWLCRCDCGTTRAVQSNNLLRGATKSCGCLNRELAAKRQLKHGRRWTTEYAIWLNAKARCFNPRNTHYANYGGRGITMCPEWAADFTVFLRDMGARPSLQHTLDRINNDGNYEPGNVRWATRSVQRVNSRNAKRGEPWKHIEQCMATAFGETKPVREWAKDPRCAGVSEDTLYTRITRQQWTAERALTTPVPKRKPHDTHRS